MQGDALRFADCKLCSHSVVLNYLLLINFNPRMYVNFLDRMQATGTSRPQAEGRGAMISVDIADDDNGDAAARCGVSAERPLRVRVSLVVFFIAVILIGTVAAILSYSRAASTGHEGDAHWNAALYATLVVRNDGGGDGAAAGQLQQYTGETADLTSLQLQLQRPPPTSLAVPATILKA
jgi:hypothetical protein